MSRADAIQVEVKLDDASDRILTAEVTGSPHGTPVFLLHGTPGSRSGPKPRASVIYRSGVKLISYDRPGYGGSTRHVDRTVADAAYDVAKIADFLEIDRFAVAGRSGGGPHALACAALLPDRVARTLVLVSVAPTDAPGLDWYGGMAQDNIDEYSSPDAMLAERLTFRADLTLGDPESLVRAIRREMRESGDIRVVDDVGFRRLLADTYTEALRHGPYGWIDDVLALRRNWGFSFDDISGPVRLWHGADDTFSPRAHTLWLAQQIEHAVVEIQSDTAHFGAMEVFPAMLPWLTEWQRDLVSTRSAAHS